ncbi:MAG: rhodanese-like domain-containing protein [Nannocystaceae bacterium]
MTKPDFQPTLLAHAIAEHRDAEVTAPWVADHLGAFRLIDVREPHELTGPLGRVDAAENIPLLEVIGSAGGFDAEVPVVLLCRSGRRSSIAADALRRAGVKTVASVEGGMLAWNLDVLGKSSVHQDEKVANTRNLGEAIFRTNGLPEVSAQWVKDNLGRFRLFDVREAAELADSGRVAQSEHVPMQVFIAQAGNLPRDVPIVVMCASGGRSGRVVRALEASGFSAVASMEGGMFGWRAQGLPFA